METETLNAKVDMVSLPMRMRSLSIDERGFPIPWFVAYKDGKPEFRAMDGEKFVRALRGKLCWVCGQKLGVTMAFVAGPMCGINRTSAEPPSHRDCARCRSSGTGTTTPRRLRQLEWNRWRGRTTIWQRFAAKRTIEPAAERYSNHLHPRHQLARQT